MSTFLNFIIVFSFLFVDMGRPSSSFVATRRAVIGCVHTPPADCRSRPVTLPSPPVPASPRPLARASPSASWVGGHAQRSGPCGWSSHWIVWIQFFFFLSWKASSPTSAAQISLTGVRNNSLTNQDAPFDPCGDGRLRNSCMSLDEKSRTMSRSGSFRDGFEEGRMKSDDGWMDEWLNVGIDGWWTRGMDGWMDGWI